MRAIKLALNVLAAVFASAAIIFAVLAWRLSAGPISLGFLSPYVAEAFMAENANYRVEFSDTILSWAGWQRSLDILVRDVRVIDAENRVLGTVPELSLGLSGLQLLRGQVSPTSIELLRPEVVLHRARDGAISFGFGPAPVSGGSDPAFASLLGGVTDERDSSRPLGLLQQLSIRDANVLIEDESTGLLVELPKADLVLKRTAGGLTGQISMVARLGELDMPIAGAANYDRASETIVTALRFANVEPARLAQYVPALADYGGVDMPISGEIGVSFDSAGKIGRATFDLTADSGRLTLPTSFMPEPLDVVVAQAKGEISADHARLTVDDLFMDFGGTSLTFSGIAETTEAGSGLVGTLNLLDLPFDDFKRFWPSGVATGGRDWIVGNVSVGVMERITAELKLAPGRLNEGAPKRLEPGEFDMEFEWVNATMNYLNGQPKAVGVKGRGRTDGRTMALDMRDGTIGKVIAPKAVAEIRNIGNEVAEMTVLVDLEGNMGDALEVLDAPPLGYASKVGLKPSQVGGAARAQIGAQFPLLDDLDPAAVAITSTVTIEGLSVDGLFTSLKASDGNLKVKLDSKDGLDAEGTIRLEGVSTKVAWRENFGTRAPFLSRYDFSLTLDDAARERLGLSLAPYLKGPLPAVVRYVEIDRKRRELNAAIDVRDAEINLPELYWSKPAGSDASLILRLALPDGADATVQNFTLQAKDGLFEGSATLDPSLRGLKEMVVSRMLIGLTDATARIRPPQKPNELMRISVGGDSLDLRPYLTDLMSSGGDKVTALDLELDVKRLITRADQQITNARGRMAFDDEGLHTAFLEGTLPSGRPLRLRLEPDGPRRRLIVQSDDAGSVARAFDVYENAIGGKLYLEARIFDDLEGGPVEGFVQVDEFKVRNAPTLANLLAFASLTGIVDVLGGEGLPFQQLYMPFTLFSDVLTVKDARTAGTSLGVNASGTVNLATDQLDLRGTIVPIYAINTALGSIPIIGDILTGGEGGGIFAANYSVTGQLETPTITVNPLSALAPGIFRNIFSILEGGGSSSGGPVNPRPEIDR